MERNTRMGMNRTGMQMAPIEGPKSAMLAEQMPPEIVPADANVHEVRSYYAESAGAVGSVPLPGTLTGMVSTALGKIGGRDPEVLIDKFGERLAFERTGTRLYEALRDKARVAGSEWATRLPVLKQFRDAEHRHFMMLADAMRGMGADPTAQTPCADTAAMASAGIIQVLTDPRTSMAQCLNALLSAELIDNVGWELLIQLTRDAGDEDMVLRFESALVEEDHHLATVKRWLQDDIAADFF